MYGDWLSLEGLYIDIIVTDLTTPYCRDELSTVEAVTSRLLFEILHQMMFGSWLDRFLKKTVCELKDTFVHWLNIDEAY